MNRSPELEAALEAASQASQALLEAYERFEVIPNARADISTDADRLAQEIILSHLHKHFPGDALCAEEATPTLKQAAQTGSRLWIVDPIDGTRGFAKKIGEFSVMIGFVHNGEVAVGVVQEPVKERLTFAARGQGCWMRDGAQEARPCHVSRVSDLSETTLVQSHSNKSKPPKAYLKALAPKLVTETYSAGVKLARVARGDADLYINDYLAFSDWDICAGDILVTEAGGKVTGLRGQTLRYGLPGAAQNYGLLATNGVIHEAALNRLRKSDG